MFVNFKLPRIIFFQYPTIKARPWLNVLGCQQRYLFRILRANQKDIKYQPEDIVTTFSLRTRAAKINACSISIYEH